MYALTQADPDKSYSLVIAYASDDILTKQQIFDLKPDSKFYIFPTDEAVYIGVDIDGSILKYPCTLTDELRNDDMGGQLLKNKELMSGDTILYLKAYQKHSIQWHVEED